MNELTLDGKIYVSSKQAAEMTGYAKDYVGQLCREGRVEARLVGRNWYVLKSSIENHRFGGHTTEENPVQEPIHANPWTAPRYFSEPSREIPELKQEESRVEAQETLEEPVEANFEPQEAIGTMQEQWQTWFNTPEALPRQEEEGNEAVSVPLHTIKEPEIAYEAPLAETRYPKYSTPEAYVEDIRQQSSNRTARKTGTPIVNAILLVVMLFAVIIGYIGDGFAPLEAINHWPMSILAGVSSYNAQ